MKIYTTLVFATLLSALPATVRSRCTPERNSVELATHSLCSTCFEGEQQFGVGCQTCYPGTYKDWVGPDDCLQCDPGTFTPDFGMTHCLPCPAGQYQRMGGQTSCDKCPTGTCSSAGASACEICTSISPFPTQLPTTLSADREGHSFRKHYNKAGSVVPYPKHKRATPVLYKDRIISNHSESTSASSNRRLHNVADIIDNVADVQPMKPIPYTKIKEEEKITPQFPFHGVLVTLFGTTYYSSTTTSISLSNSGLTGTIPSQIGLMTALTSLDLSFNSLTGTIPTALGLLTALRFLDLDNNSLSGTIPTELTLVTTLTELCLDDNALVGTIPTALGLLTALTSLDLDNNSLSGTIPTELTLVTTLTELCLDDNALVGTIPTALGLLTALTSLDLDNNSLSGTIPTELTLVTTLTLLCLNDNELVGTIPTALGLLTALRFLDLDNNNLSGTTPTELGLLTAMLTLDLHVNSLFGTIPTELALLKSLERLRLGANNMAGTIPTELGLLTALTTLYLETNSFTGTVPSELGLLPVLAYLFLQENSLTGMIPFEICVSRALEIDCGELMCPGNGCPCSCLFDEVQPSKDFTSGIFNVGPYDASSIATSDATTYGVLISDDVTSGCMLSCSMSCGGSPNGLEFLDLYDTNTNSFLFYSFGNGCTVPFTHEFTSNSSGTALVLASGISGLTDAQISCGTNGFPTPAPTTSAPTTPSQTNQPTSQCIDPFSFSRQEANCDDCNSFHPSPLLDINDLVDVMQSLGSLSRSLETSIDPLDPFDPSSIDKQYETTYGVLIEEEISAGSRLTCELGCDETSGIEFLHFFDFNAKAERAIRMCRSCPFTLTEEFASSAKVLILAYGEGGLESAQITCERTDIPAPTPPATRVPTDAPVAPSPSPSPSTCFSGDNHVQVQDKGDVMMSELQVGDKVLTSPEGSSTKTYEPVYAFGHRLESQETTFVKFWVASGSWVEMTAPHLIHVQGKDHPVTAGSVQVGDILVGKEGENHIVTLIKQVRKKGIYAPLTSSGNIVVNGLLASTYVSLQQTADDFVQLGSSTKLTLLSQADLSHMWVAPLRMLCSNNHQPLDMCKALNKDGLLPWVALGFKYSAWVQNQNIFLQGLMLLATLAGLIFVNALEAATCHSALFVLLAGLSAWQQMKRCNVCANSIVGAPPKQKVV